MSLGHRFLALLFLSFVNGEVKLANAITPPSSPFVPTKIPVDNVFLGRVGEWGVVIYSVFYYLDFPLDSILVQRN